MSPALANEMIVKYAGYSPVIEKEKQDAEENLPYFIDAINEAANRMYGHRTSAPKKLDDDAEK